MMDLSTIRQAWGLFDRRERRNALIVLALMLVTAFSSALMVGSVFPFLAVLASPEKIGDMPALAWAYDSFGFETKYGFLVALGIGSLVAILIGNLLQMARVYVVSRFTMMRVHTLSHRLLSSYLRQPYEFFLDRHSGDMAKGILSEAQSVVSLCFYPAADLIASTLTVIAIVALLVWVDPVVAAIAFVVLGGFYGLSYWLSRAYIRRIGQERVETNAERYRIANEALAGIKDIKVLGREAQYVSRYERPSLLMARGQVAQAVLASLPTFMVQAVAFGGIIVLCLAMMDRATFGEGGELAELLPLLGVFAFAGQRLLPELAKVYGAVSSLRYGAAAVETVARDLAIAPQRGLPKIAPDPLRLTRELRLEEVTYRYPNAANAGLTDVSLSIRCGERIGVVGSTGAGKTTLADILLGLLHPQVGRLLVDGTPIADENLRSWQQSVAYVPQDIFLTDASIAENIALGMPADQIDQARVEECAGLAQLHDFVREELPRGYESSIGERGVRLSGGQRQRIGIARALYHDADLIVFDEATSALDNLTETEVMAAIEALPGNKTILVIAHRLSTVKVCDRIAVLERGRLIGLGAWEELIRESAIFRKMTQTEKAA